MTDRNDLICQLHNVEGCAECFPAVPIMAVPDEVQEQRLRRYGPGPCPPRGIPPVEGPSYHGQPVFDPRPAVLEVDEEALSAARAYCEEPVLPGMPAPARRGDWIQTVSGRQYWPLDPRADEIEITDVAHHLGMLCRFTGACLRFYSVAEHSVHVFVVVSAAMDRDPEIQAWPWRERRRLKLRSLLHDGPEFAINDIARPVKREIEGYDDIEAANWTAFCARFEMGGPDRPIFDRLIKQADNAMLLAEQAALMAPAPATWAPVDVPAEMLADAHAALARAGSGWGPDRAKWEFLQRYQELAA